jgi:hypothetical protein
MVSYRGVAMALLPDDRVMAVIKGPEDVMSGKFAGDF